MKFNVCVKTWRLTGRSLVKADGDLQMGIGGVRPPMPVLRQMPRRHRLYQRTVDTLEIELLGRQ